MKKLVFCLFIFAVFYLPTADAQCPSSIEVDFYKDLEGGQCEVKLILKQDGVVKATYFKKPILMLAAAHSEVIPLEKASGECDKQKPFTLTLLEIDLFSNDNYGTCTSEFGKPRCRTSHGWEFDLKD